MERVQRAWKNKLNSAQLYTSAMIYFDHNATTPVDPLVYEAMEPFFTHFYGNPSSLHRHGRAVKTAIEQAREQVARLVNVNPDQVIFTSGGTEANSLAITAGLCCKQVLFGATEHPSVVEPIRQLSSSDIRVEQLPVDAQGHISTDSLADYISTDAGFISIMQANNETGVIQDIAELAAFANQKGITFHTDAVQTIGKLPVDFSTLGVNLMSLSAHKIYGPKGAGALIHDKNTNLSPVLNGGGQEAGLRAGTENVAAIIGFGKAAQLAMQRLSERCEHYLELRTTLESAIKDIRGLSIAAHNAERLVNTSQILIDGIDGEMLLMQLDQKSIAVSSGSACSSNSKAPSPILKAMGYTDKLALSAIRVSFGQQNTLEQVSRFVAELKGLVNA